MNDDRHAPFGNDESYREFILSVFKEREEEEEEEEGDSY